MYRELIEEARAEEAVALTEKEQQKKTLRKIFVTILIEKIKEHFPELLDQIVGGEAVKGNHSTVYHSSGYFDLKYYIQLSLPEIGSFWLAAWVTMNPHENQENLISTAKEHQQVRLFYSQFQPDISRLTETHGYPSDTNAPIGNPDKLKTFLYHGYCCQEEAKQEALQEKVLPYTKNLSWSISESPRLAEEARVEWPKLQPELSDEIEAHYQTWLETHKEDSEKAAYKWLALEQEREEKIAKKEAAAAEFRAAYQAWYQQVLQVAEHNEKIISEYQARYHTEKFLTFEIRYGICVKDDDEFYVDEGVQTCLWHYRLKEIPGFSDRYIDTVNLSGFVETKRFYTIINHSKPEERIVGDGMYVRGIRIPSSHYPTSAEHYESLYIHHSFDPDVVEEELIEQLKPTPEGEPMVHDRGENIYDDFLVLFNRDREEIRREVIAELTGQELEENYDPPF